MARALKTLLTRAIGPAGLALVAGGALHWVCAGEHPASSAARDQVAGRRVVLVGLDAADWLAIDPLVQAGKLPGFARLKAAGRTGLLLATPPLVSPILWTTIATGRQPEDHGILDFTVELPSGAPAPVAASNRRVPALWNFFSASGRRVAVVGWWATWPAEQVRGTVVSDRVAPQLTRPEASLDPHAIFPARAAPRLSSLLLRADQMSFEDLRGYLPLSRDEYREAMEAARLPASRFYENRLAHLAAVAAGTRTYADMAEALLREGQPVLLAVYLEAIDTVSHLFVKDQRRGPPAIERAYRDADSLLGRLAALSPPDTLFVVCSDHGFQPPTAAAAIPADPTELTGPATAWHRPYGMVAVAEAGVLGGGPPQGLTPGSLGTVTPLDIAPTVLHAAGLPVDPAMPGRVVREMLPREAAARAVQRKPLVSPEPTRGGNGGPMMAGTAEEAALARLRALGYVGSQPTSLARTNLGEILYRRGQLAAAERALRGAVESQPGNLAAHLWLAKTLRDQQRPREALRVYAQALALPGGLDEALVEAVELAASSGLPQEARRMLAALRPPARHATAARVARAILARAQGRTAEAERELRRALATDPTSFDALSRLLDGLLPGGRAREALPYVRRAVRLAAGSPRHLALLGETLLASGQNAAAEDALRAALELAPDSAAVRIDLARAQLGQKKWDQARATLSPAPPSQERSILLGASYSMQERWREAAAQYQAALAAGSPTPELLNGLGWAQLKLGQTTQAAVLLRRSLTLNGQQPKIRRLLAQIDATGSSR